MCKSNSQDSDKNLDQNIVCYDTCDFKLLWLSKMLV